METKEKEYYQDTNLKIREIVRGLPYDTLETLKIETDYELEKRFNRGDFEK